eukprot:Platyproteum_vivax@DN8695_c0_g1_i1.p1
MGSLYKKKKQLSKRGKKMQKALESDEQLSFLQRKSHLSKRRAAFGASLRGTPEPGDVRNRFVKRKQDGQKPKESSSTDIQVLEQNVDTLEAAKASSSELTNVSALSEQSISLPPDADEGEVNKISESVEQDASIFVKRREKQLEREKAAMEAANKKETGHTIVLRSRPNSAIGRPTSAAKSRPASALPRLDSAAKGGGSLMQQIKKESAELAKYNREVAKQLKIYTSNTKIPSIIKAADLQKEKEENANRSVVK